MENFAPYIRLLPIQPILRADISFCSLVSQSIRFWVEIWYWLVKNRRFQTATRISYFDWSLEAYSNFTPLHRLFLQKIVCAEVSNRETWYAIIGFW